MGRGHISKKKGDNKPPKTVKEKKQARREKKAKKDKQENPELSNS